MCGFGIDEANGKSLKLKSVRLSSQVSNADRLISQMFFGQPCRCRASMKMEKTVKSFRRLGGAKAFDRQHFFPQQRKLMGFSAQISSGVCRCGSQGVLV